MKPKLGQMTRPRPGWEIALSPIACVRLADREMRAARLDLAGVVAQFERIELKSQSKSPVSQGVARSGKTQWHPYCSQTLINATNVEPRISWLPPSCTNREHAPFPAYSIRGQANPIQHKPLRRRILADMSDPCYYGEFQYVLLSFGPSSVSVGILNRSKSADIIGKHGHYSVASRCRVRWWDAPEFSSDCPLQPRGLSPTPLELGAHLYLQALREIPPHPFLAVGGAFFPLVEWPP